MRCDRSMFKRRRVMREDVINKMIEFERQAIPTKPPLTDTQPVVLMQEDIATLKL